MGRIVLILLLIPSFIFSQTTIAKVGTGEYFTGYLGADGKFYGTTWNGSANVWTDFGLTGVTDVDGAQYDNIVLLSDGSVRTAKKNLSGGGPLVTNTWTTDTVGNPFTGNSKVYGWFQTYLTIRNDSVWYFGNDNETYGSFGLGAGYIRKPMKLGQPPGRAVSKLVIGDQDTRSVTALCTDGTVWTYTRGSTTPVQKSGLSGITDIGGISRACYVATDGTNMWGWGQFASYIGLSDNTTTPTLITSTLTAGGVNFPLKQIANNYNILGIIDANDDLFFYGDTPMGESGTGQQLNPYRTVTPGFPFVWSFTRGQKLIGVTQLRGKWKNLCNSGSIAFFFFAQDLHNQWYSWGRNKEYALGNGLRKSNDGTYPCWGDIPSPNEVDPSVQSWTENTFNPNDSLAPVANASAFNIDITADTVTVFGDYSSQQEHGIASYAWTKVSGTGGTITSPSSMNTQITGLSTGTYVFRLTVTNTDGQTDTDDITLYVDIPAPPYNPIKIRRGGRIRVQ